MSWVKKKKIVLRQDSTLKHTESNSPRADVASRGKGNLLCLLWKALPILLCHQKWLMPKSINHRLFQLTQSFSFMLLHLYLCFFPMPLLIIFPGILYSMPKQNLSWYWSIASSGKLRQLQFRQSLTPLNFQSTSYFCLFVLWTLHILM